MNGDKLSLAVTNYVAFEEKIDNEIDRFVDLKEQIILEIRSLHKVDYVQVLFKLYVQYKSLSQVADDLGWTYACAANTHSKALRLFEDIHPNLYYLC
jgi:hypothetical protein